MGSEIMEAIDMTYNFWPEDLSKDKETKELLKLLLRTRREMKFAKKELKDWCLRGVEELQEIAKTSTEVNQKCGLDGSNEDLNASVLEDETDETSHEITTIPSEERKFLVFMDVSNFKIKEMEIRTNKNQLVIRAEHGNKLDDHGFISRKFTRKFDIPEGVDTETLRAFVDAYKVLIVEGSFRPQEVEEKSRNIVVLKDTCGPQPFRDLKQFTELAHCYEKDFKEMTNIAENLAKNLAEEHPSLDTPIKIDNL